LVEQDVQQDKETGQQHAHSPYAATRPARNSALAQELSATRQCKFDCRHNDATCSHEIVTHEIVAQDSWHNLTVKLNATEETQDAAAVLPKWISSFPDGLAFEHIPSTIIRAGNQADRCAHIE